MILELLNLRKTSSSVKANSGEDQSICLGEETTTLTANRGNSYEWCNGTTIESLEISPFSTETYKVTVIKNN